MKNCYLTCQVVLYFGTLVEFHSILVYESTLVEHLEIIID